MHLNLDRPFQLWLRNSSFSPALADACMDQSGTLVFLLFVPLLWVVWLAVIYSPYYFLSSPVDAICR
jgi:hypothetical protein